MDILTVTAMIKQMRNACHNATPEIKFISEDEIELRWLVNGVVVHRLPIDDINLESGKRFMKICIEAKRAMRKY